MFGKRLLSLGVKATYFNPFCVILLLLTISRKYTAAHSPSQQRQQQK